MTPMRIYVYSKCSTCKIALRVLGEKGIKVEVKEITETPPSKLELKAIPKMFQNLGIWQRFCPDFIQAKPSHEKSALLDIGGFFGREKSRDKIEAKNQILEYFGYMLGFQDGNVKKLFNTSGILYREMGLTEKLKSMPLDEAMELLSTHGMLVKRPFLLGEGLGLLGSQILKMQSR